MKVTATIAILLLLFAGAASSLDAQRQHETAATAQVVLVAHRL